MSMIPEEVIEQVRDVADIVHLIGQHVELKRTGADYRGPCPLHSGEGRNFSVIPRKQMFYCFVCHEGGDVFTFYMKHLGMDYPTAVREVAKAIGVPIPERQTSGPDPNEPLFQAVAMAADWYARQLRDAEDAAIAREYLSARGFPLESHHELQFGFAPRGETFADAMKSHGLADEVLQDAGLLVTRDDGTLRPRFWNRLLIPIHDLRGRVVGFGGRVLGDGEPKYLNSPETKIFHKGKLLYNLHHAKQAIRKAERASVVEGYFDVLVLGQVGVENVVASLGTSLTHDQAALLRRYTDEITLLYDSDKAGQRATFRAAEELLRVGSRVAVATLPDGQDPDSLARQGGAKAINELVSDAIDVIERMIQLLDKAGELSTISGRRKALDKLLPKIRAASDQVTQELYVSRVAEALGMSQDSVRREVQRGRWGRGRPGQETNGGGRAKEAVDQTVPATAFAERSLITVLMHAPAWRARVAELIDDGSVLAQPEKEILAVLLNLPAEAPVGDVVHLLSEGAKASYTELLEQPPVPEDRIDLLVEHSIAAIERRRTERELRRLDQEIPFATGSDKDAKIKSKKEALKDMGDQHPRRWKVTDLNR